MEPPQSITLTIWQPTPREAAAAHRLATTVNSNRRRGEKRATLIETPYSDGKDHHG